MLPPLAVSAENPNDPAPGIPDDTNDPDDPDKNTTNEEAAAMPSMVTAKEPPSTSS